MQASQIAWMLLLPTILVGRSQACGEFVPLGDLPGGDYHSVATGVSADGSAVVGFSVIAESGGYLPDRSRVEAFRWTQSTGMKGLGFLPTDVSSVGVGISARGSVVVGSSVHSGGPGKAFRWRVQTGMVNLGFLTADSFNSAAEGVSGDGSVVVGFNQSPSQIHEAFRWTRAIGMVSLGDLPGGGFESVAHAVSMNGLVIVGQSESVLGLEAFRWTQDGGMIGLGKIPGRPAPVGGGFLSEAFAVSADGSVVVGRDCEVHSCAATSGNEAFRWTEAEGMVGLGVLPGGESSEALAVSADGSVVVGFSYIQGAQEAFLWDSDHGMRNIRDMLIAQGRNLDGWRLAQASGVSADGRVIVGTGINPDGNTEAWLARLGFFAQKRTDP